MALFPQGYWEEEANRGAGYDFWSTRPGQWGQRFASNWLGIEPGGVPGTSSPADLRPGSGKPGRAPGVTPGMGSQQNWWERDPAELGRANFETRTNMSDLPMPSWAYGNFPDQQALQTWYQANKDSESLPAAIATYDSAAIAQQKTEAARAAAIDRLGGTRGMFETELGGFREDPVRAEILAELQRRASPEFRAITELQESAAMNSLAQEYARANAQRLTSAGSRGAIGSGTTQQTGASFQGSAAGQGLQTRALISGENEAARAQALNSMATFSNTTEALEMAYFNAIGKIDAELARIEADVDYQPTDFMVFDAVNFARQEYAEAVGMREREMDLYEQNLEWGPRDTLDLLLRLPGSGIPEWGSNFLGGFGSNQN